MAPRCFAHRFFRKMLKGRAARKFEISDGRRQCIFNGLISTIRGTVVAIEVLYLQKGYTRGCTYEPCASWRMRTWMKAPRECRQTREPKWERRPDKGGNNLKLRAMEEDRKWDERKRGRERERRRKWEGKTGDELKWIWMFEVEFIRELIKEK